MHIKPLNNSILNQTKLKDLIFSMLFPDTFEIAPKWNPLLLGTMMVWNLELWLCICFFTC